MPTLRSSFNLDCEGFSSASSSNVIAVTRNLSFINEAETSGDMILELTAATALFPGWSSFNWD